jgi:hypothetical protein
MIKSVITKLIQSSNNGRILTNAGDHNLATDKTIDIDNHCQIWIDSQIRFDVLIRDIE